MVNAKVIENECLIDLRNLMFDLGRQDGLSSP
jgi:hypothetical protein